jgi:ethanolamine ammonia-lyase large subunit
MSLAASIGSVRYRFGSLREVMAKASPARSGDMLAGVAAPAARERMAARLVLAELPLRRFLDEP